MFVIGGILIVYACLLQGFGSSQTIDLVSIIPHGLTNSFDDCRKYPRLELNQTLMMSLLNAKIYGDSASIYYSSAYLAPTQTDAEANFINMMTTVTNVDATASNRFNTFASDSGSTGSNVFNRGIPLAKKHIVRALTSTRTRRETMPARAAASLVLPEELGIPSTVLHSNGAVSTIEYCRPRGEATGGSLLPLCSICAATTKLTDDYFPPYVNEIYCGNGSSQNEVSGCLQANNMSHGTCTQNIIYFSVLKAQPTMCELVTILDPKARGVSQTELDEEVAIHRSKADNRATFVPPAWKPFTYWIDGWDTAAIPVGTGCECMVHKDSFLSDMVGRYARGSKA